ncbi:6982_t:CDS:1, partial [Entrophospora sp. SA101]
MGILLSIYDLFKPSPVTPILSPVTLSNFSSSTPGLTSDSFQSFPPDCIPDVLKFLDDDLDALYSCLFVNRLWCRMTIPILWSNPFRFGFHEKSAHLIHIYISCLPENHLNHLIKKVNLNLPRLFKPIFNYPKYLKIFQDDQFIFAIRKWLSIIEGSNDLYQCKNVLLVHNLLSNYIFNNCVGISDLYSGDEDLSFPYYVNDISSFTGIERSLVKLNKFGYIFKSHNWNSSKSDYQSKIICNLFNLLSNNSFNIKNLYFNISHSYEENGDLIGVVKSMVDLIESQNNLQYLSFYEFWSPLDSLKIFNSLKSQSSTLRYLCFKDLSQLNHLLPILSFLKNLETLHLDNCCLENYDSSNSILKVLGSSKIKNLYCRDDRPNANVEKFIKPIIESSNINLKTISLDLISNSLIDVINFNCPNLTHLSLSILTTRNIQNLIYQENPQFLLLNSLINLLNSLKYLKHLHLHIDVLLSIFQSNDDFLRFSKSLPSSLLYFGIDFEITSKRLGNLLKECPASLKILSFQRALDLNDECLKVLINYAKINSNFRELRIDIDFDLPNFSKDLLEKAQNYIPIIDKALPET